MLNDVRYAMRALAKRRCVTVAAALSLALGMGATAIIFSWVRGVLWDPLPGVRQPRALFAVAGLTDAGGVASFSYPDYLDLRDGAASLDALIASNAMGLSVGAANGQPAEQIFGSCVSGNYFSGLGVQPVLGRLFSREETETPNAAPVAIIGHRLWQRRFGGAPSALGATIVLNGRPFEIIGIAPEAFWGTLVGADLEVWLPVTMQAGVSPTDLLKARGVRWLQLHGRLKPGVTPAQAQADLDALLARLASTYPDVYQKRRTLVLPLWQTPWGAPALLRGILLVLGVAVAFVLILTAANVANLLVARALDRRREMAVRVAMGASRGRLMRQMLIESLLLGVLGGVGAAIVASGAAALLVVLIPPAGFPIRFNVQFDAAVLVFVAGVAVVTGIVSGVGFAVHGSRADPAGVLKEEAASVAGGRSGTRLRHALVVAEVAIATVVLAAAALSLRSVDRALRVDPGFDPEGVLLAGYDLRAAGYTPERGRLLHVRILEQVRTLPGVQAATLARSVPLGLDGLANAQVTVDGYMPGPNEDRSVRMNAVGPEYLKTMDIALRRGRDFTGQDDGSTTAVAIVNETMAQRFWREKDPIGARFRAGDEVLQIVGVAADSKYQNVSEEPRPFFYRSVLQQYRPDVVLHVRTAGDPTALAGPVREILRAVEPNLPVLRLTPLRTYMRTSLFPQLMAATLLAGLAFLSMVLVMVGLCSVIAYAVSQRTRELAIRLAFGAGREQIVGLIVREAAVLVACGVAIGLVAALALVRFTPPSPLLLGMNAWDPLTFVGAPLLLIALALSAALLPALAARRVDPITALRHQ